MARTRSLSTRELRQLRADQEDYFPDTCTLQTKTETTDSQGGFTVSWANTHTGVKCRVMPIQTSRAEQVEGDQLAAYSRWILRVPFDQTIDEEMRVVHDSVTYEIERLTDTHSDVTAVGAVLVKLD